MKSVCVLLLGMLLFCTNCGNNGDDVQYIDQTLQIHLKDSTGKDLLNPKKIGSYSSISINDALAETKNAPVSFNLKLTSDSVYYIEYIAGAKRNLVENSTTKYQSKMVISLTKKISENTFDDPIFDTIDLFYNNTPLVFEVDQLWYNNILKFQKKVGSSNTVSIVK